MMNNAQYGDIHQQSWGDIGISRAYLSVAMDCGLPENGVAAISMDQKFNFPHEMAITCHN